MGTNDPRGGVILNPRVMNARVYEEVLITLLHTKYTSFWSCGFRVILYIATHQIVKLWALLFRKIRLFYVFPRVRLWDLMTSGMGPFLTQGHDSQDLCKALQTNVAYLRFR